jgi:hypothetical protein
MNRNFKSLVTTLYSFISISLIKFVYASAAVFADRLQINIVAHRVRNDLFDRRYLADHVAVPGLHRLLDHRLGEDNPIDDLYRVD